MKSKTNVQTKINKEDYCQFLIGAQKNFTMTAMSEFFTGVAHDKINRWAKETKLTPSILWEYAEPLIDKNRGYLIGDDIVLEKEFGENIELSFWQYSPSDKKTLNGIGVVTLIWTDGKKYIPINYRIYAPKIDGKTKNDHFREMLREAKERGFNPEVVVFDTWYAGVDNLKAIDSFGWTWITEIKKNRIINKGDKLENTYIPQQGLVAHLRAYGWVKLTKRVVKDNHLGYLATNDTDLSTDDITKGYAERWNIEEFHRGLKQTTGIEECQARIGRIQRNHIFCSILAFMALEVKRIKENISWYQSKYSIIKDAIRNYLKQPTISLCFA